MDKTIADIVIASQDALVRGDIDRYVGLMAEDVVLIDPLIPRATGREAARKFLEGIMGMFAEIAFTDRKVFPLGRSAAMRFSLRCRTTAGKEVTLEGVDVFEVNEAGLIQQVTSYYDSSALKDITGG